MAFDLEQYTSKIAGLDCMGYEGEITRVTGSVIESRGPAVGVGQLCEIHSRHGDGPHMVMAEVIGFREQTTILMPLQKLNGMQPGDRVVSAPTSLSVGLGRNLLGRVLDGVGNPIDHGGQISCPHSAPIDKPAPHPLKRLEITQMFSTGIRAIDLALTLGKGQRVGIFSGAGVGKSTMLGEIARYSQADANVIALIGERGREVGDFIRNNLGPEGLKKATEMAVLNANYLMKKLKGHYDLPHDRPCMHECVFTDRLQEKFHVSTLDIAKRLIDYGFHPPTIYFPLVVKGALMIEPTETESKESLDRFIETMIEIAREAEQSPDLLREAPRRVKVRRLDEVLAARKPKLKWTE